MPSPKITHVLNREKGQFPISIATSLALESLLNIHPETSHSSPPIFTFDSIWVNTRTIFRNMYTSMDRLIAESLETEDLLHGFTEDLNNLLEFSIENKKDLILYYSHYKDFSTLYPYAKLRIANTPKQLHYQTKMDEIFSYLFKQKVFIDKFKDKTNGNIYVFNDIIKSPEYTSTAILTHFPYDLLDSYSFSKLILLESHTGSIKDKSKWYTKYLNGKELPPLPFRLDLMQIFGDKEFFSPAPKKVRDIFLEAAKKYNWTTMTTKDRIIQSISGLNKPEIAMYYSNIVATSRV